MIECILGAYIPWFELLKNLDMVHLLAYDTTFGQQ